MNMIEIDEPEKVEVGDDQRPGIPDPSECARRSTVEGTPVVMGDGRTWPLAPYIPTLGGAWDRIYDDNVLRGAYEPEDIRLASAHLILENFDLPPEAVATLITGADLSDLVVAVENAMFGPKVSHFKYSDWAIGSLYANGIDPASIPASRLRDVLDFLLECKRTISPGRFISSAEAAPVLNAARTRAAAYAAAEKAKAAKVTAEDTVEPSIVPPTWNPLPTTEGAP
jgi:hypothetical protein